MPAAPTVRPPRYGPISRQRSPPRPSAPLTMPGPAATIRADIAPAEPGIVSGAEGLGGEQGGDQGKQKRSTKHSEKSIAPVESGAHALAPGQRREIIRGASCPKSKPDPVLARQSHHRRVLRPALRRVVP